MRGLMFCMLVVFAVDAYAREPEATMPAHRQATTEIGRHEGADYRIDMPANWNGGLVVYFHGYELDAVTFEKDEPLDTMFAPILKDGFAIAQSGYSQAGWAVEQGSADSERLRTYFIAMHGQPKQTFAMGLSMGGTLTVMALESAAQDFDGALTLCGVLEPTDVMMQRDFALRAAFDYYFPRVLGALVPVPVGYLPTDAVVAKIAAAMRANPKAAAAMRAIYKAGDSDSLPSVIAFVTYDVKEMQQRAHGNPFGNADLIYTGPEDNFSLNDGVHRYHADARATVYLSRWYTPTGNLLKPLLALHTSGDQVVVASTAFNYALLVQRAGRANNFVQQYVNADGHCTFTPKQIGRAFDELVEWSRSGRRPPSGRLPL